MQGTLPDHHYVRCGDGIVFLDLSTDSYSCRYHLCDRDSAAEREGDYARNPWIDPDQPAGRIGAVGILRFIRAYIWAGLGFRGKPLKALLAKASALDARPERRTSTSAQVLAAQFETLSLFLPFPQPCLLKSFALFHFLHLYGHAADWVVGVQLFPFRAHCWLALDNILLAERAHLLEDYRPILTLQRTQ